MDRDERWDRNKLAWDAIVLGRGARSEQAPAAAVSEAYTHEPRGDEFLEPIIFSHANEQRVRDGDVVLWFNFRADRAQQLSIAFLRKDFAGFDREVTPAVHYVTLTEYDKTYGCPVVFGPQSLANILGEVVSKAGLAQLRIAETEKYPHVTYFFNGGLEKQYPGEDRIIVPSPKDVPTYDYKPQMSAPEVTAKVVEALPKYDLVILNFANPDMVGHTGVVEAGITAVETIDECVKAVVEKTLSLGGELLITADHGNCEQMRNRDGSPNTAHTTNLVHFLYVAERAKDFKVDSGILADISPTLLFLLGLKQPAEMTGHNLVTARS
jgi:2,3-bisphosphoglycerate-independent phosphoglycerate mutase